ncbi:MAG: hypothetical protein WC479_03130 [Candidatus Izemoplasmatales bacterium]
MCQAFSLLITKSKKVYWKAGLDSHDELQSLFQKKDKELKDDKLPPKNTFARVEIVPANKDYLKPDKWVLKVDEEVKPTWWDKTFEKPCFVALDKWKEKIYGQINLKELNNPVHPFKLTPPKKITRRHLRLLKEWTSVWDSVRDSVGTSVWTSVGDSVGDSVRDTVGTSVWTSVGDSVGDSVRDSVRASVGTSVGDSVGDSVRDTVGDSVWTSVGTSVWDSVRDSVRDSVWDSVRDSVRDSVWDSVRDSVGTYISYSFPKIKTWKYVDKRKAPFNKIKGNPFRSAVKLWKMGLVASCDSYNKIWRLHGGPKAEILWSGTVKDLSKV